MDQTMDSIPTISHHSRERSSPDVNSVQIENMDQESPTRVDELNYQFYYVPLD